jgi:hypothetical protein
MAKGEESTGWEVTGLARANDELRKVAIVVCTADIVQSDNGSGSWRRPAAFTSCRSPSAQPSSIR